MAHYDIFREELAQKFHAYGHALWEPSPGELYGPVAIGDVGYIRRGKFHRIFNMLLPGDHRTHENFGVPEDHESLELKMENHIDTGILSPNDFCSAEVRVVSGGLNIFSLRPEGSAQASFECSKRRGALLSIPVSARREDTVAQGLFANWITKHIDAWFSFAQSLGLGLDHMEDIVLVTGCHRTRSYTNILFSESRDGARVSFGVRVGSSGADVTWEVSREQIREVQIQRGPSGDDLSEDQCIFVRGFRVTRFMGIFPTSLRAAAGPAPLAGSDSHNPPSDKQPISTSIPESNTDPLHVLLRYVAEKEPDSGLFLVHDNDLGCIGGTVLGSLLPDTLMDYLQKSQLKTRTHDYGCLAGPSQVPVKVGMLSERALDIFLGSKPPDTPLLESTPVPLDSIGSEGATSNQRITARVSPTLSQQINPHVSPTSRPSGLPQITRDYLVDGYISYTFTSRDTEFYVVHLFKRDAASVGAICDSKSGAYTVYVPPSHFSPPIRTQYGDAWVLDYAVRTGGGSVVPQQRRVPHGQGDRRRYVDQAQFRMPIFFVNANGALGVPVMNAVAGHMQLRDEYLPPSLLDKTTTKIRIGWPGYAPSEHQVQLRDQTPAKNPIAFDRFVKHVGSRVRQFLMDCERVPVQQRFSWMVGHGNITSDEVMLIGIVQVSEGSWMPILQLMRRVVV